MSKIHLISIGGAVMHNIALALQENGHTVSGSDDEIYNPSKRRLLDAGLLPAEIGWHPERIHSGLDAIILGMHAREGNPEMEKSKELGIPMYSFPEYIYEHAKDKKRVVVAGSHGKTSTTSMIMHALKREGIEFDYLVGGQIEGFDLMVRLSDAPLIILEGDEYLSSALDRRPKMLLYKPHIGVVTGIAWDHMNVFPTFEIYKEQFDLFLDTFESDGKVFCFSPDQEVKDLMDRNDGHQTEIIAYDKIGDDQMKEMQIFGPHNQANLRAAELVCNELGMSSEVFMGHMIEFTGTAKRLQKLIDRPGLKVFFDFAHAPSKLRATVEAVRLEYPDYNFIALYELHTFSSLNKDFIMHYAGTMDHADKGLVFYNAHTLAMKKMPDLSADFVKGAFANDQLEICTEREQLETFVTNNKKENTVFLFMTSGNFGKLDINSMFD